MQSPKYASTPLPISLQLSQWACLTSGLAGETMKLVLYALAVCSLMYAMVATRPDIAHAVGVVSKFMHNPNRSHWNAAKHVGTQDLGILFGPNRKSSLMSYTNSDFVNFVDNRKSTTEYCFKFENGATSKVHSHFNYQSWIHSRVQCGERGSMAQSTSVYILTSRSEFGTNCL